MAGRFGRQAYVVVEVLLVVITLGILALIVWPRPAATDDQKESALVQSVQTLRGQLELYKLQHEGVYPGATSRTAQELKDQMTEATSRSGAVGEIGDRNYPLGPYFLKDIPANPYNGGRAVKIASGMEDEAADESQSETVDGRAVKVGWYFDPETGRLKANAAGEASDGRPLDQL